MFKTQNDLDALGAEALPGGLAEIHRTLEVAFKRVLRARQNPARRGVLGFFAWRKKPRGRAT